MAGQKRVTFLVRTNRLDEAAALTESLIHGDCEGDFDSLKVLDGRMFAAGVLVVQAGRDAGRFKSLRAAAMAEAASALDLADASTNAEAADRYAEIGDWGGAVRWQSLALSYAPDSRRAQYQETLERYFARFEARTPTEDFSPASHK